MATGDYAKAHKLGKKDYQNRMLRGQKPTLQVLDRDAIFSAIHHAEDGDMVAIIGKGHEDYQEIEGVRYHFKDREVVEDAVKEMR